MNKIFDAHIHYVFKIPLKETIELFKKEFKLTGVSKYNFLSVPHYFFANAPEFQITQNIKGLFLKKVFSPNAYCFAGLEHPMDFNKTDGLSELFLNQVREYYDAGFDGIKMFEGYPQLRKWMKIPLDSEIYDKFYNFCEENNFPITLHVANPEENWDIKKVDPHALKVGRYCDKTFPSKKELTNEVFRVMKKHPKLKLALAHFGFLCYDINDTIKFLEDYPNTMFDITPGGEQLLMQAKDWDIWSKFYDKYQDRIIYGTDLYAFEYNNEEEWITNVMRRPKFLKEFYETNSEHIYINDKFKGVNLDPKIREKIYMNNALKFIGKPKNIDGNYFRKTTNKILKNNDLTKIEKKDLKFIVKQLNII